MDLATCHKLIVEAYCGSGCLHRLCQLVQQPSRPFGQQQVQVPWCMCRKCCQMDQVVEQVCCHRRDCCITDLEAFETIALDISVLSVAILNRCVITADDPEYTPRSYCKAAYRQFIVWQNGYLGPRNRCPVPACIVWAIRDRFPELSGTYLGFREYQLDCCCAYCCCAYLEAVYY